MVRLFITHSVLPIQTEKPFDETMTVGELKRKIYQMVGTSPEAMKLELYSGNDRLIHSALHQNNNQTLTNLGITEDYMRIHVVDQDKSNQQALNDLNDVSQVKKYEISEEDYDKRQDTFRKWKEKHILPYMKKSKNHTIDQNQYNDPSCVDSNWMNQRCEIQNELKSRGTIAYVGKIHSSPGYWVGVKLDEPVGKNDGSAQGKKYFDASPKYGIFVRPDQIKIGDYPELDYEFDE